MPWVGWNLTRFDHPVLMSTDLGATVFNTNCDRVWHGALIGWWTYVPHCPDDVSLEQAPDASTRELRLRAAGLRYVRAHLRRAPVVVAARVGREWGIYRPNQTRHLDERSDGNRWPSLAGFVGFYVLILLSIPGLVFVRRRHLSVLPFAALAATVTITAACFYGSPRFRTPVEVGAVVLAAVAIDGLLETPARRRGAAERDVDSAPAPTALAPAGSGELTPVR